MRYKSMPFTLTKEPDTDTGTFEGYGSVFDVLDHGGDIVRAGAFKKSIEDKKKEGRKFKMLHRHNQPIGVFSSVKEDDHGLFVKGRPLIEEVQLAKETIALMRAGAMDELSIGYRIADKGAFYNDDGAFELTELHLVEVSIVPFGMNSDARVTDVKAADLVNESDLRDLLVSNRIDVDTAAKMAHEAWKVLQEVPEDTAVSVALDGIASRVKAATKILESLHT